MYSAHNTKKCTKVLLFYDMTKYFIKKMLFFAKKVTFVTFG